MSQTFLTVLSMNDVVQRLQALPVLAPVERALAEADGHVLAADVLATEDLPAADRSGMDGYAVRAADLLGASENNPAWLDLVGQIAIDQPSQIVLQPGQCMGIVTGGYLPPGADAVIMVEHTAEFGAGVIEFRRAAAPGEYIMRQGEDARQGQVLLGQGTLLRPQEVGLLAALGITSVTVYPRPRVAIISTGDEVVAVEVTPQPGQIRDVNSPALAAMVQRQGCVVRCCGIVPDQPEALSEALRLAAAQADVVLLSGGSSVGVRDYTVAALNALPDASIFCHGVAMSPGKPLILGTIGRTVVWGLPGQVTSAQVVAHILTLPFLRHLAGESRAFDRRFWRTRRAELSRNVASRQGREDHVRVRLEPVDDNGCAEASGACAGSAWAHSWRAVPVPGLSGLLRTLIESQGVIRIPANLEGLEAGTPVDVILFEQD